MTTRSDPFTGAAPTLTWTRIEGSAGPLYFLDAVFEGSSVTSTQRTTMRCDDVLASADHEAQINCGTDSAFAATENYAGPAVRIDSSAVTYYCIEMHWDSGMTAADLWLVKVVTGTRSLLTSTGQNQGTAGTWEVANDNVHNAPEVRLSVVNESGNARLKCYVNDTQQISYLDNSSPITTGVRVGYTLRGTNASAFSKVDSFSATDLVSAATDAPAELASQTRAANSITVQGEVPFNTPTQVRAAYDAKPAMTQTVNVATATGAAQNPTVSTVVLGGNTVTSGSLSLVSA